ncbi:MAG: T9SS type A sorting domain-containing protein [Bacteroidales bacterium]
MKTIIVNVKTLTLVVLVIAQYFVLIHLADSQTIYTYTLFGNFESTPAGGPDLVQIPNNSGLTGYFTTREIPFSTCEQGGTASGYFFEDDAGLQFNNPAGFIDNTYSLAMNFQIDEFISPPPWVRLLSFTHVDDIGIYIKLTNPPDNGTLEFWPYGTVGEYNFFNTYDFYQLILVRNSPGLIKIFINGQEFAEYDDSNTQKFLPGPPSNYIVFFRDHPSVLANEASPGFVSNIILRNQAWTAEEVDEIWENFCPSLIDVETHVGTSFRLYPNPVASNQMFLEVERFTSNQEYRVLDLTGRTILQGKLLDTQNLLDLSRLNPGLYTVVVQDAEGNMAMKFIKQ